MGEAFRSLLSLVSGQTKIDVPVPACLNHCINQEVFNCKVCGEIFDNIHKYITHGKGHRVSSSVCGWCGGVWPNYSALTIHQLVWEEKTDKDSATPDGSTGGGLVPCPLACGMEPLPPNLLKSHLTVFHGAKPEHLTCADKDGVSWTVDLGEDAVNCPKCSTKLNVDQAGQRAHLAFQCLRRSRVVQERVQDLQHQSALAGEDPALVLLMEVRALILHVKGLLEKGEYKEKYIEDAASADLKYNKLPLGFSTEYLCWVPVGYTLQVLLSEEDNFPVMFDLWCQVVERLAGPENLQEISLRLEGELVANLSSGLVPRWPSLNFDPAMLDTPEQSILTRLERELGWAK